MILACCTFSSHFINAGLGGSEVYAFNKIHSVYLFIQPQVRHGASVRQYLCDALSQIAVSDKPGAIQLIDE